MKRILERIMTRVTVAHSVPGRIRLHVPAIAHIPDGVPTEALSRVAVGALHGVSSVRVNPTTSTLLVQYDGDAVKEAEVVALVESAIQLVVQHRDRFATLSADKQSALIHRLQRHFGSISLHPRERIVLPHDIWDSASE